MLQKRLARWKNTTKTKAQARLCSTAGNGSLVFGIALLVFVMVLFLLLYEKQRVQIVASEVSADITTAITGAASSHLFDSYSPVRDGSSGAYRHSTGSRFTEIKDTTAFRTLFAGLYRGAELQGDTIVMKKFGRTLFIISDLQLSVRNAVGAELVSTYRVEYTLTVMQELAWAGKTVTLQNQVQLVDYMHKF